METRRATIQQLLWDQNDTTRVPHPVKERNLEIKQGMQKAIVTIGEMDPKESLPPILDILNEMIQLTHETEEQNKNSLIYVMTYLSRANEMQHKDFTVALGEIQKEGLLAKMIPALEQLVKEIKLLKITTTLKTLTEELAVWLEGLYFHTLKRQQKGGWLQLPDPEDLALKAATFGKVNKLMVATYYHEAAIALETHLKKLEENNDINPLKDEETIPLTNEQRVDRPVENISIEDFKDDPVESKFPLLMLYMELNDLTILQKRAMSKFKPEIISILGEYINDYWRFFNPQHSREMQKASDDIERSENPVYWVNRLYTLWNYLKGKKSYNAFSKVTLLLNTSCGLLYTASRSPAPSYPRSTN